MQKVLIIILVLVAQENAHAQTAAKLPLTPSGAYEQKEIVLADSVSMAILYGRAMEALSDWTGSDGKAKIGIDYQDKETGTVIYKGSFSLGFKNVFLGDGWDRYADFTMKIKCKDGRSQVTLTIPYIIATYRSNGTTAKYTLGETVNGVNQSKGNKRERGEKMLSEFSDIANGLLRLMRERLKYGDDDDF